MSNNEPDQKIKALPWSGGSGDCANTDNNNARPAANNTPQIEVGAPTVALEHLGPIVINSDGTTSRISNWTTMSETEKEMAMRLIPKRNERRRAELLKKGINVDVNLS